MAKQHTAIRVVTWGHLFEFVCWEAAQSLTVMRSRAMGLAEEAKMPAVEPATAEPVAAAVVAPWCLVL